VLDIGSGGGIDCFIASEKVGARGKVIGLDMTDEMLEIARRNGPKVAESLGYPSANTEFRKGEAEKMPVEDESVDLIISNCVINLSPAKAQVFSEMFRVLKPGGRFTVSDILTDVEVPQYLRGDAQQWGACLTGALSVREYVHGLWDAGFRGVIREKDFVWKKVDGIHFISVTLTGYKLDPQVSGDSQFVTLKGPFSRVVDEGGERFERGRPIRVSGDKARQFALPSYRKFFIQSTRPQMLNEDHLDFLKLEPAEEPCFWQGHYAMLVGPFRAANDDDQHTYSLGAPVEICSKTERVLTHAAYQPSFCVFNRAQATESSTSTQTACETEGQTPCC